MVVALKREKPMETAEEALLRCVRMIARGRADCGKPLAAEVSRQMAREILTQHHLPWPGRQEEQNDVALPR